MTMKHVAFVPAVAGLAGAASAQTGGYFAALPSNPGVPVSAIEVAAFQTVEVELWAQWDGVYAFAASGFQLDAGGDGYFELVEWGKSMDVSLFMGGPSAEISTGQIHFPPTILGSTANPIHLLTVSWTEASGVLRDEPVLTSTSTMLGYTSATSGQSVRLAVTELSGVTITVVPAPSALALLGMGGLAVARRRR